jgi:serine/threonine protein kinase
MASKVTAGADAPLSGLQLAQRYSLADEMPSGALCRIFRGEDQVLKRPVVVKAVPPHHVEVYGASLHATSALTHPATIALYDAIHENGWLFLVQEAIAGNTLTRYLQQGVPSERAVKLALQLALALAYSHHRDILHGDLTPTAILVDRSAIVRINNFGLPPDLDYFLAEGGGEAQELIAGGTAYGDVLAIGLLLRQMLSSAELAGEKPGARQLRPEIAPELAHLAVRCTVPESPDALTDAESLVIALERMDHDLLAKSRVQESADTPPVLRAARTAQADMALWSAEQTVAREQTPFFVLERESHEVGSLFTQETDPGHSDGASTRATDDSDLAMAPRLRLPTRPLRETVFSIEPTPGRDYGRSAPEVSERYSATNRWNIMLGSVLLLGALLFIVFFLIGYLGPFSVGGH